MQKCVRLTVRCCDQHQLAILRALIENAAKKYDLEGTLYVRRPDQLQAIAAGSKDTVDQFIDQLHRDIHEEMQVAFEIEAASKDRDYRGVFRIVE